VSKHPMARSAMRDAARKFLVMRSPEIVQSVCESAFVGSADPASSSVSVIASRLDASQVSGKSGLRGCTKTSEEGYRA